MYGKLNHESYLESNFVKTGHF